MLLLNKNRNNIGIVAKLRVLPSIKDFFAIIFTFLQTVIAWIFFRADDIQHAISYLSNIFSFTTLQKPILKGKMIDINIVLFFIVLLLFEWLGRRKKHPFEHLEKNITQPVTRWFFYLFLVMLIYIFKGKEQDFIYFQF